ncbi:signal peptide peptidase SppA [Myxococcota bacterium]|nr:signal peptide peptidase SppA [Myxococcota bacterium]
MRTASRIRMLIVLLLLCVVLYLFLRPLSGGSPVAIAKNSTLVLELGGGYVEAPAASPLARLAGDRTRPFIELLSIFSLVERDARIGAVVLRIQPLEIGWGKADELRAAIARLREKGHKTVALLEVQSFSANKELYVGSAADELWVAPGAGIPLVGMAAEYIFLGGFWQKLGVDFDIARAGKYKSAVEIFSERTMSEASREMANSLLDDTFDRFVAALASDREKTPEAIRAAIDQGYVHGRELSEAGLIEGEIHLDELLTRLGTDVVEHADYLRTDPRTLGFDPKARFALVYGSGTVVQGDAEASPLAAEPSFASDTVSRAILDAADDPDIAAILLRIDSPGGSAMASELIWRAIRQAREKGKPVVASFSDVAASGGYYVASAADAIVSDPGTLTGSIGVFALRPVIGGLLDKLEIGVDSLTRGAHADFLLSSDKMTPEAHERLQSSVLETYQLFLSRVAEGRGKTVEQVDGLGQGRVWTGQQALDAGLVDELGGLYTAVRRTKQAVGLDLETDVELVAFPKQKPFTQQIVELVQGVAIRAAAQAGGPPIEWPEPLGRILAWTRDLPLGTPLLIPPVLVEIR